METPKEKAKELVEKYLPLVDCGDNRHTSKAQKQNAKQCALIAIDEMIEQNGEIYLSMLGDKQMIFTEKRIIIYLKLKLKSKNSKIRHTKKLT